MRAVVYAGDGVVRVDTVADPRVEHPEDAVVRVVRSAVCGTDLHVIAHPDQLPVGFVLGHEFVGEVVEVGAGVRGHAIGDLVAGTNYTACGRCWWCRRGAHWHCPERRFFGTGTAFGPPLPGAQAELVRVPYSDAVLHAIPPEVSADAAIFLTDTLATGYAAVQRAELRPGDTLAIIGGGPVGQLTSLAAQAAGAGIVLVVEPVATRRELAQTHGALAVTPDGARGLVDELTDRRGADAVVDAAGGRGGLEAALRLVRARGVVVGAGVQDDASWPMPAAVAFDDELTVRFVIGDLMRDYDALLALLRSGVIDPTVLASQVTGLDEIPEAYARMADRSTLKPVVAM
jgi:alcohol dehydrogenase